MKKIITTLGLLSTFLVTAQTVGKVGINSDSPKTSLDVNGLKDATTGLTVATDATGLQAPRLTRAELTAKGDTLYGADQTGALIYITDISAGDALSQRINITSTGYYFFDGTVWLKAATASANTNFWNLTGHSGTTVSSSDDTNFLGTTDNVPLQFRVNNQQSGYLSTANTAFGVNAASWMPSPGNTLNVAIGARALSSTPSTSGVGQNVAVGLLPCRTLLVEEPM